MIKTEPLSSVWCYSIYGNEYDKYYYPIIENIKISKYFGARIFIHTNRQYEKNVKEYFAKYIFDIDVVVHNDSYSVDFPKILRFLTSKFIESDFYFFKDSDSVVTEKELVLMNEWMNSNNPTALIMRDHPLHIAPIMAGMFGLNRGLSIKIADSALGYFANQKRSHFNLYSYDQDWLARNIYPEIVENAHVNTSFFYYSGERIKRMSRQIYDQKFIGAQEYKKSSRDSENLVGYMNLYGEDLLSLPYFSKFAVLYGKVRPTLYAAYLIKKIKKIIYGELFH